VLDIVKHFSITKGMKTRREEGGEKLVEEISRDRDERERERERETETETERQAERTERERLC
jgi:hypothetical protein